ncbi:MAG: NDP-sugar synthase [Proteobacteria bacterium]|nr:NDP-sugar synthase [Pseudomonadota bacterium]
MIRKAVILAAGRGTRLQPLTVDMPKPMIPLLGKPVMAYIVEHLARQGVREIMVNVSHMADQIERYFGNGERFGVQIGYSYEGRIENGHLVPEPLGSAGALRKIQDHGGFIDETTAVLCGDALVDVDLQAAYQTHRHRRALATVVTKEVPLADVPNYGVVVSRPDGQVVSFQEKPSVAEALSRHASTGIYLIDPKVLAHIPSGRTMDIGSELFPTLVRHGLPFQQHTQDFRWLDIGRVSDYWRIVQALMRGGMPGVSIPGEQVRPGVFIGLNAQVHWESLRVQGPVYIGSGAVVAPGVTLVGPTWIGRGARVEAGATVERSILFDYAHIGANAMARERIISGAYCVSRDGQDDGNPLPCWLGDARCGTATPQPTYAQ